MSLLNENNECLENMKTPSAREVWQKTTCAAYHPSWWRRGRGPSRRAPCPDGAARVLHRQSATDPKWQFQADGTPLCAACGGPGALLLDAQQLRQPRTARARQANPRQPTRSLAGESSGTARNTPTTYTSIRFKQVAGGQDRGKRLQSQKSTSQKPLWMCVITIINWMSIRFQQVYGHRKLQVPTKPPPSGEG